MNKAELERWDNAFNGVICIKEYKTLKVGAHYQIRGRGNLEHNSDPEVGDKKGYGFCIEDDKIASHKPNWWKLPYSERTKWYYFTLEEMSEYFITEQENYDIVTRDNKIKQILND